ncbi:MAG: TetR/AcrR family transcriptional regulator [Thermoleophilaceae bacterium]|nr:TetR/AcrR family transcriptional regulator [Thermoleophilaceae bacterium]
MASTRERMVASTALLIREKGARATSIDDVLAHSGAPRGSVYHHFPGGREQLLEEATDFAGGYIAARISRGDGPLELLDSLIEEYREELVRTGYRAGCPIVAVAVEAGEPGSRLHEHAAAAFAEWRALLTERLVAEGVAAGRADELAVMVIAAVEGALVMARAARDAAPLETVHNQLRELVREELGEGRPA